MLLAGAAVVWIVGHSRAAPNKTAEQANRPQVLPVIARPQPLQLANFSILRSTPEGLPDITKRALRVPAYGVNWALAQRLSVGVHGDFWAIPGNGFLCIVAQLDAHSAAQSSATTAHALTHGVPSVLIHAPGSTPMAENRLIVGLAPDRARSAVITTAGSVTTTPVTNNIFVLRDSATDPPSSVTLQ